MAALLLIAHAPLATALAGVAAHAFPDCARQLRVLDVAPESDLESVERALRGLLRELAPNDVLILADVFGATPCNAALRVADGVHARVVAGVNVPMLWRSLCYAHEPLDHLVRRAVDGAVQGTLQVSAPRVMQQHPSDTDDQDSHHDQ